MNFRRLAHWVAGPDRWVRIRENHKAARKQIMAYDVLVREETARRGQHIFTIVVF